MHSGGWGSFEILGHPHQPPQPTAIFTGLGVKYELRGAPQFPQTKGSTEPLASPSAHFSDHRYRCAEVTTRQDGARASGSSVLSESVGCSEES